MSALNPLSSLLDVLGVIQTSAICAVAVIVLATLIGEFSQIHYPDDLPRVREPVGRTWFRPQTRLAYYTDAKALFRDAYLNYSKHGKTVLVPGLGLRKEVIIPPDSLRWVTSQPDNVLNSHESMLDLDQIEYSVGSQKYIKDAWQVTTLIRNLNPNMERVAVEMSDEVQRVTRERFHSGSNVWKEVELYRTLRLVIAQVSNRFTVGRPLCRNMKFNQHIIAYGDWFVNEAGLIGLLPKLMRPLFAPILTIPMKYHCWAIKRMLSSTYYERMQFLAHPEGRDAAEPWDHLQIMMRFAQKSRPDELTLDELASRIALASVGANHQTAIAITNIIFNVVESDARYNTISALRDEIEGWRKGGGTWTRAGIARLVKCDSIMRETLRINSFGNRSAMRKVMVDNLRTEDGILLPKGAEVSILSYPAHTDQDIFEDPFEFDPFRFSRLREVAVTDSEQRMAGNLAFVSTGPQNLPFGHGRHACPGRFILDFELKMLISEILMNYDIKLPREYNGKVPDGRWVAEARLPSSGRLLLKRRAV